MQDIQNIVEKIRSLSDGEKRFSYTDLTLEEQLAR